MNKSEEEWKEELSPEEFEILRNAGTERPIREYIICILKMGFMYARDADNLYLKARSESDCGWPSYEGAIQVHLFTKKIQV